MLGERRGRHVRLHAERGGDAARQRASPFLGGDQRIGIIETEPAELDGLADAEKTGVARLPEQLVRRKDFGVFPLIGEGIDLRLDETPHRASHFLVFVCEDHVVTL